jgi:hypothetical protein
MYFATLNIMKKLFLILIFSGAYLCLAQPQWKFHIAFEDATGAKDTIWLIWDSTATSGIDFALGEGPVAFDYNSFNVFTHNINGDSTKTVAFPYYSPYPFLFGVNGGNVYAFNYQYPITKRWDSSLFSAPYLPPPGNKVNVARIDNQYFFGVNNSGYDHFNMLIDNTAYAPAFWWGSQSQFPMSFNLSLHPLVGISSIYKENGIIVYPNPFENQITISTTKEISVEIYSITGNLLISEKDLKGSQTLDLSHLPEGIFILKFLIQDHIFYEKIIKI